MRAQGQPYNDPAKPGRLDINGEEWWACDPYPTWYRWEGKVLRTDHAEWADDNEGEPDRRTHPRVHDWADHMRDDRRLT